MKLGVTTSGRIVRGYRQCAIAAASGALEEERIVRTRPEKWVAQRGSNGRWRLRYKPLLKPPVSDPDIKFFKTWKGALDHFDTLAENARLNPTEHNLRRLQASHDLLLMQAGV